MFTHGRFYRPNHFSNPKVVALQTALRDPDPFYSGICTIPDYQRVLYYTDGGIHRRIDFSNVGPDALEELYRACKPAEFGRGGENVLDESYRKAGKMDLTSFATLCDPRSLGIHEKVSGALLTWGLAGIEMELYKLNVYGKGNFFKAHKDTPRGQDMFGSLVVILPTMHEGGQLVLRHGEKDWTIDFTDKIAAATEPSVCYVAFFSDVEHEVLPVTSGYRITLTYNLYHKPFHVSKPIPTPFRIQIKKALVDLVNDKSILPNGGYLGFGLAHEYVHTGRNLLELLLGQLKGSDRALADVCDELGLSYFTRLLYREAAGEQRLNFLTTSEIDVVEPPDYDASSVQYLDASLQGLTSDDVEGVSFAGSEHIEPWEYLHREFSEFTPFYKNPITEVFEVTPMKSSVNAKSAFMTYGNESELDHFYGTACILVAVDSAKTRKLYSL